MSAEKGFHCAYCDVTMTGKSTYDMHMDGKKHKKKLKALGAIALSKIAAMPASSTSASTSVQQVQVSGYAGKFVKPTLEVNEGGSGAFAKGQCSQVQTVSSTPVSDEYKSTQTHAPSEKTAAEILGVGNADPVMNAVKANMLGALPLKKPAYDRRCEICQVDYTSKSQEEMHLDGKKHNKKLQMRQLETLAQGALSSDSSSSSLTPASFYCGFCNLQLNSLIQLEQHRQGTAHLSKVKKCQQSQSEGPTPAKRKFVPASETVYNPPTSLPKLEPLTYDK